MLVCPVRDDRGRQLHRVPHQEHLQDEDALQNPKLALQVALKVMFQVRILWVP